MASIVGEGAPCRLCTKIDIEQLSNIRTFDSRKVDSKETIRPTRLVEIEKDSTSIRLVLELASNGDYAALSYVWGQGEALWRTVKENIDLRHHGFTFHELPQTPRDSVLVAARLGLRYIWIECLCILQDDLADWEKESVKMDAVYGGAIVTLMACSSVSSTWSLFNERSEPCDDFESRGLTISNELSNRVLSMLLISPPNQHYLFLEIFIDSQTRETLLLEGGWTSQEWVLSPRKLYICPSQLFWECGGRRLSEDGVWKYSRHYRSLAQALMTYVEKQGET